MYIYKASNLIISSKNKVYRKKGGRGNQSKINQFSHKHYLSLSHSYRITRIFFFSNS